MTRCFGCGKEFQEENGHCPKCGLDIHVLREVGDVHSQPRFLFGRVETPVNPSQDPPVPQTAVPKKDQGLSEPLPRRNITRKKKSSTPDQPTAEKEISIQFRDQDPEFDTSFLEPDGIEDLGPKHAFDDRPIPEKEASLINHFIAVLVDFGILIALNSILITIIVYQTSRDFSILFKHSFLPLLLVHLAFSGIFLFLFTHFFGHSPGSLALKKLSRNA